MKLQPHNWKPHKNLPPNLIRVEREGRLWSWPAYDDTGKGLLAVFDTWRDILAVLPFVTDHSVVVQAGGACGVFPYMLAEHFRTVYTFEPDDLNFRCLSINTVELGTRIRLFRAALGAHEGNGELWDMPHEHENAGATQFVESEFGPVPMVTIDSLALSRCGLIYLDIEGYEPEAIAGAKETIRRCRPVICIEEKGLCELYGHKRTDVEEWLLDEFGYRAAMRVHNDIVFVPPEPILPVDELLPIGSGKNAR